MKLKLIDTVNLPDYSLPYFVNGDMDSYTDDEIIIMNNWRDSFKSPIEIELPAQDAETFFTWSPCFGLACMCYSLNIYEII